MLKKTVWLGLVVMGCVQIYSDEMLRRVEEVIGDAILLWVADWQCELVPLWRHMCELSLLPWVLYCDCMFEIRRDPKIVELRRSDTQRKS